MPYHAIKDESQRYMGKIYVLINRYSHSQSAATAALIQDYKLGTIIGEETSDFPTNYGSIHQFNLPNTQIAVSYPKAFIVRHNGNSNFHSVKPDITVNNTGVPNEDPILRYTLELIDKEVT